ncbi:MAG: ATP-binding cassette, subfamily bacterial IrtB/YbtQ [Actinomycetota bacterium]|nr:ATP-binding cassette, subfamily bacterial IrtB/YbtQ [Actinomycetota bacterium]
MTTVTAPEAGFYRGPLGTLWYAFGERRRPLVLAVVARAAASVVMGIPVAVAAWCVDAVRTGSMTSHAALMASAVVAGSVAVQYVLWFVANRLAWVNTFHAVGEGRIGALRHVQHLPVGTVTARGTGDLGAVLTADYEQVAVYTHHGLMNLVGGAALPVAGTVALGFVDPLLALVVTASVLAAVPVFRWVNHTFVQQSLDRADALAEAGGRIVEYVQGIATARSYDQVGPRLDWYRQAVARMREVNDRLAVRITPLAYVSIGTVFLGVPLILAVTGYAWLGGHLDGWSVVVFLVVVLRIYAPLVSVAVEAEGLRLTDAALRRIAHVRDLPVQAHPASVVARPADGELHLDRVTFGYDQGTPVLHEVSLVAPAGTVTAIVGPSGAGKSTLLSLAARFHDPDSGTVRLGGVPLPDLTRDQLFDAVTVVFQDVYLFAGTIRDNIAFGAPDAKAADVEAVARVAHCHAFITALPDGYDTRIGEGGMTLSGGERQRLSIARALLKNTPVILLDEPTSALDPITERVVQSAVTALARGRTVLVVAHRLSTIAAADQILVMREGRIVQCGRHAELLAEPDGLYFRLWAERERAARWRLDPRS